LRGLRRRALALACAAAASASPALCSDGHLRKVSFIPMWTPQAQFAGFYMAQDKGFYKKRGLEVVMLQGGPDVQPEIHLRKKKADFGILWLSEAIVWRSRGMPLVHLAQVRQNTAMILVAKKSSGILKPSDMAGRKVGLWEDMQIQPLAFFREHGVAVRSVRQSQSINLFLRGGVDVASAMSYNELHTILQSGLDAEDLTVFRLDEHGLDFPEDGIYCMEETFRRDPALARAFVAASKEGWAYAFAHTEETLESVLRRMRAAFVPADKVHQRWMLDELRKMVSDDWVLKSEDFERVSESLSKNGMISGLVPFSVFAPPAP
jgi:NitT/TauT family transport system substrate-binding protein